MDECVSRPACIGRREFLVKAGLVAGATVLTISRAGAAVIEDVTVPVTPDGPLAKVGGSQVVDSSAGKIIVLRTGEKTFAAFSALCTHKKGLLKYDGKQLVCPKHGSAFDASNGKVTAGPAEEALRSYATTLGEGSVRVAVP